ncbi:MAG: cupin domain-containing protein [Gemmatimonadetes bacterium]|nr:cupin domain-containing protein [Gemmatimonadota bacterium]NIQ56655.1 cupin domain-containing protein [Gemmatimonadota bacterium]NIU76844.1 cupin domain-containing protein [Gammaproteobacteria bacterium]NIX46229.1 cupin domain-containing protein [Gemmatimonadota bacterium]NIY10561.1 cupin domain-containing protein [Gemmatimonadota bacterium]
MTAPGPPGRDPVRNLDRVLEAIDQHWFPKVVARVNDHYLKVARVRGELTWHAHDGQDELFLVLRGRLRIELEDGAVELGEGDVWVVPAGVRHNPVADEECWVALVEPVETEHTGGEPSPLTRSIQEQLEP